MEEPKKSIEYESLNDDEGDMQEDKAKESKDPKDSTQGSSEPAKKKRKKRRSKAWETFDELPIGPDNVLNVRCSKCGFTCVYNSVNGTGNMLKHQKVCLSTGDIRQMILSSSQGSISVRNSSFDPNKCKDRTSWRCTKNSMDRVYKSVFQINAIWRALVPDQLPFTL